MSARDGIVKPVAVYDPRTVLPDGSAYAVLVGGSDVLSRAYAASSTSLSLVQWDVNPPSASSFVDRRIIITMPIRLTITGTPANGIYLVRPNFDAPRAFPVQSSLVSLQVSINGVDLTIPSNRVIHALSWMTGAKDLMSDMTPCFRDQSQTYDTMVATNANPLAGYGSSLPSDLSVQSRGGFGGMVVVTNPVGDGVNVKTAIVDLLVSETLCIPPLWSETDGLSREAFFGVNTLRLSLQFGANPGPRMWSHSSLNGADIASITATWGSTVPPVSFPNNQPSALITYITPNQAQRGLTPERIVRYPYSDIVPYQTSQGTITAGATVNVVSNNLQFGSVPKLILAFVRRTDSSLESSPNFTDTYLSINSASLQWLNKSSLLASMSREQLYVMSRNNGVQLSYAQWAGLAPGAAGAFGAIPTTGSILAIRPGIDFGLAPGVAAGSLSAGQVQLTLSVTNRSAVDIPCDLILIMINEGMFTLEGLGRASTQVGVLDERAVQEAVAGPSVDYSLAVDSQGAGPLSDLWSGVRRAASSGMVKKALSSAKSYAKDQQLLSKAARELLPDYPQIAEVIASQGYGMAPKKKKGGARAGMLLGPGESARATRGGIYSGGAMMSRGSLASRLLD